MLEISRLLLECDSIYVKLFIDVCMCVCENVNKDHMLTVFTYWLKDIV